MKPFEETCKVKSIEIEGRRLPAVSLGTSPFIGAGQFGSKAEEYHRNLFLQPHNMVEIILESVELGVPSVQVLPYDPVVSAVLEAQRTSGVQIASMITIGVSDLTKELGHAESMGSAVAFIHAQVADSLRLDRIETIIGKIRERGLIPGCATHAPARTIPFLEDAELDVQAYLAPVNAEGVFMGPDQKEALAAMADSKKLIIAKKVLAAGRIAPRKALEHISTLGIISGMAIGIASPAEARETFSIALRWWGEESTSP